MAEQNSPVARLVVYSDINQLNEIFNYLDKVNQSQATHHKTISVKNQVYGWSACKHSNFGDGTIGVLPDCQ
jgi:hypothetical protein